MKSDDCSCSATDRKGLLKPHSSRRLAIFQLVEPLEKTNNDVLSNVPMSVRFLDGVEFTNLGRRGGGGKGEVVLFLSKKEIRRTVKLRGRHAI